MTPITCRRLLASAGAGGAGLALGGASGFVSYTELTQADTRKLAQQIDALAELLSEVPAQIVSG